MPASTRVVTVAEGEDLMAALDAADAAWINAVGTVQGVEIKVAGQAADPTRALHGRLTLVSLTGPGEGPWGAVLARATDSGLELLGGELVRATSLGVKLALIAGAPVALSLAATQPAVRAEPVRSSASSGASTAASAASNWAAVASASARAERARAVQEEIVLPEPNDLVRHFAFGLCEVLMAEDERLKIRDLEGPGRIREIKLDMLRVRGPVDHDGKRLFHLERKL